MALVRIMWVTAPPEPVARTSPTRRTSRGLGWRWRSEAEDHVSAAQYGTAGRWRSRAIRRPTPRGARAMANVSATRAALGVRRRIMCHSRLDHGQWLQDCRARTRPFRVYT